MVTSVFFGLLLTIIMVIITYWLMPLSWISLIFFLFTWFLWTFVLLRWKEEWHNNKRDEEMYYWMQNFITTLSIKKTITETLTDLTQRYQLQGLAWLKAYTSNESMQTLINLKQRFKNPIYEIFTSTLNFYEQQGGEVMTLFESIMFQGRLLETRRIEVHQFTKRYLLQWIFLWLLNLLILIIARFSLADIFRIMQETILFQILMLLILGWLPISKLIWFYQWSKNKEKLK